jgi:2-dehydropantoate 2-reductase
MVQPPGVQVPRTAPESWFVIFRPAVAAERVSHGGRMGAPGKLIHLRGAGLFGVDEGAVRRKGVRMSRIAIVGPGAVGAVMAAWLGDTGRHQLVVCARRPITEISVTFGERTLTSRPTILTSPGDAKAVDWVLVATKAYDCTGAAAWLAGLCSTGAPVAILQNGVEHRERFSAYLFPEKIVPVMVDCPAERHALGQTVQRGAARLAVANDTLGREFATLFGGTPITVSLTDDIRSELWKKLCVNAAGAISAVLLQPAGVMREERIGEIARGIVRECIAVGRAEGAVLDDSLVETVLQGYCEAPPDAINSLHADRAAGRPMESDARNGVIVRLGRKHDIPTPFNQRVYSLLEASAPR